MTDEQKYIVEREVENARAEVKQRVGYVKDIAERTLKDLERCGSLNDLGEFQGNAISADVAIVKYMTIVRLVERLFRTK